MLTSSGTLSRLRREEAWDFRLIYFCSYVFFLLAAVAGRFLPRQWRPSLPGAAGCRSVFGEARSAASTVVPFAFMGW